jgi:hypothetical protein
LNHRSEGNQGRGRPGLSEGRVMDQLANPRNEATHAGETPSRDRAIKALSAATVIVDAANPLPLPANIGRRIRQSST